MAFLFEIDDIVRTTNDLKDTAYQIINISADGWNYEIQSDNQHKCIVHEYLLMPYIEIPED
jgi:hypothetical protein